MASTPPKYYPRFGAKLWWGLREEFKHALPKTPVDVAYLTAKLGIAPKSARNLIPNLRALGLIDEAGKPTDLAVVWRDDQTYKQACQEVLQRVFPEVMDRFPPPDPDRDQLARWFANTTRTGEASAQNMAAFYKLIAAADLGARSERPEKVEEVTRKTRLAAPPAKKPAANGEAQAQVSPALERAGVGGGESPSLPTLHIDIQIHLAADAPDHQIESLFRYMAKYIYRKSVDGQPG